MINQARISPGSDKIRNHQHTLDDSGLRPLAVRRVRAKAARRDRGEREPRSPMPTRFEVGGLYHMFVQYGDRCNILTGEPDGRRNPLGTPIRVVRISPSRDKIWYESGGATVMQSLWADRVEHDFGRNKFAIDAWADMDDCEFICNPHGTAYNDPFCDADALVPLRRNHPSTRNMIFIQKKYRDAVVRNWFKVWCAFKLLALAQRARKRANEPGGCGARAAQANFERAAKRQRS